MKRIPLVDLQAQHATLAAEVMEALRHVVEGQTFILGEPVARFERGLAERLGAAHAVGVASCTDALVLSLEALGLGPGDAVVTTPLTFVATAEAIVRVGATPVFVDVEEDGFNLCPRRARELVETWEGPERLRAILVVHLFGACADMSALTGLAEEHGLHVVEDAAQAMGATWGGGAAGTLGVVGCYSFFPSKTLGGWGDGGALLTSDGALAARARRSRQHGVEQGRVVTIGANSRLDALQAAVLSVKLRHLDGWLEGRRRVAARYDALLAAAGDAIARPRRDPRRVDVPNPYVVRVGARERVLAAMRDEGIEARAYYDRLLPDEPAFAARRHHRASLPRAEAAARTLLALPTYPELSEGDQERVADALLRAVRGA